LKIGIEIKNDDIDELILQFKSNIPNVLCISAERISLYDSGELHSINSMLTEGSSELLVKSADFLLSSDTEKSVLSDRFLSLPTQTASILLSLNCSLLNRSEILCSIKSACESRNELEIHLGHSIELYFIIRSSDLKNDEIIDIHEKFSEKLRFSLASDPMWEPESPITRISKLWHINGFHPERWVRRYSFEQLKGLCDFAKESMITSGLSKIIFSHSGRWDQYLDFFMLCSRGTGLLSDPPSTQLNKRPKRLGAK
jgi:hypothetical protein